MGTAQRDDLGRFVEGHSAYRGSPGRPPRAREEQLISVLREVVTEDKLIAMVEACVSKAEAGDVQALRVILSYLIGQPPQQVKLETGRVILVADGAGPFADSLS